MILRVNGRILDFNDDVEVQKQSKVFESIEDTVGDFSYSFSLAKTSNNVKILGVQYVDILSKPIYRNVNCDLLDNDGIVLYTGYLRVERINDVIECSFFSGNYNWISKISGQLSDLDFSQYDTDLNYTSIIAALSNSEGITFPYMDAGGLITRAYRNLLIEDFNGTIYVKTVFKKIFQDAGIKLKGELINDPIYQSLTVGKNNKSQDDIDANSIYAQKTSTTARPGENAQYKVTFQNDSVYPYYNGSASAFDLANSRYVSPVKQQIEIEVTLQPSIVDSSYNNRIYLWINGVFTFVDVGLPAGGLYNSATPGDQEFFTLKRRITLEAGDILEVYSEWQQSLGSTQNDVLSGSIKITPQFIYQIRGNSLLPNWTKQEFVSNILNLFNTVSDFDPVSKELTFNFFDRIKSKPSMDISEFIEVTEVDFEEFISSYWRNNYFKYSDGNDEEIRDYNVTQFIKYGSGVITVNNDFLEESGAVLESKFTSPISYINPAFASSTERVNFLTLDEDESSDITSVTDNSGVARLNISDDKFLVGDLVRIKDSKNPNYNGDWLVTVVSAGYIEVQGMPFDTDSTATVTRLIYNYGNSDSVYLFVNIPDYGITNFSNQTSFYIGTTEITELPYGFFNILQNGTQVNQDYRQSISFGSIDNPLSYQRSLIDSFWSNFQGILNDPVKLRSNCHFTKKLFLQLTPLNPVFIRTMESSNLYYINQILGYKNSYTPCEVQLIKL